MANGIRTDDPRGSIKDVVRSSVKVPELDKHLKKAGGHINWNVVEITIKMKTIVRKPLMIKIIKLRLRNLDNWINVNEFKFERLKNLINENKIYLWGEKLR